MTSDLSGGSYTILSMSELFDGMTITGLSTTCCSSPANDNILFPSFPQLDLGGLAFGTANGDVVNLFTDTPSGGTRYDILDANGTYANGTTNGPGSFTADPATVSEPASFTLIGTGLIAIGATLRRRKS